MFLIYKTIFLTICGIEIFMHIIMNILDKVFVIFLNNKSSSIIEIY